MTETLYDRYLASTHLILVEGFNDDPCTPPVLQRWSPAGLLTEFYDDPFKPAAAERLQQHLAANTAPYFALGYREGGSRVRAVDIISAVLYGPDPTSQRYYQQRNVNFPTLYSYKHVNSLVEGQKLWKDGEDLYPAIRPAMTYPLDQWVLRGAPVYGVRSARAWPDRIADQTSGRFSAGTDVIIRGGASGAKLVEAVEVSIDNAPPLYVPVAYTADMPEWGIGTWSIPYRFYAPGQVMLQVRACSPSQHNRDAVQVVLNVV